MEMNSIASKPAGNTKRWRLFLMVSSAFYMLMYVVCIRAGMELIPPKNAIDAIDYKLFMETQAIYPFPVFWIASIIPSFIGLLAFFGAKRRSVKILIVLNVVLMFTIVAEIVIVSIGYSLKDEIQEALIGYTIRAKKLFGADEKTEFYYYCCGFQGVEHYRIEMGYLVEKPDFCYSFLKYDNDAYRILKETGQCPPLFEFLYVNGGWSIFIVLVLIVIANAVLQVLNFISAHKLIVDFRLKDELRERHMFSRTTRDFYVISGCSMNRFLLNEEENADDGRDAAPIRRLGPANEIRGEPVPLSSARALGRERWGASPDWVRA